MEKLKRAFVLASVVVVACLLLLELEMGVSPRALGPTPWGLRLQILASDILAPGALLVTAVTRGQLTELAQWLAAVLDLAIYTALFVLVLAGWSYARHRQSTGIRK